MTLGLVLIFYPVQDLEQVFNMGQRMDILNSGMGQPAVTCTEMDIFFFFFINHCHCPVDIEMGE